MTDNITLPREVVKEALEALELEATSPPLETTAAAMAALRAHLAAPPEDKTHPGYVIGSHWLETAYSRICAGEAEADVLRDCGWERTNESLKATRDKQASMLRRLEEREAELDAEIGHLRRENERLREALQGIAEVDLTGCGLPVAGHIAHGLVGTARAALRREET